MGEGGDRGFLFRALGLALLAMVAWRLAGAGGILAGGDEVLANREAMAALAPWVLLGLFFLRGPLPARKSAARVVGFQFLNLGFLAGAAVYALAAVPLDLPAPQQGPQEAPTESDWLARDRVREINAAMEQLEKESAEVAASPQENPAEVRRQEAKRQQQMEQMEQLRSERSRLAEALNRRGKVFEEKLEKEREERKSRLARAQTGAGGAALLFVLMGLHGLVAGFFYRGLGPALGGFPVVSSASGKVESSIPGALRPKRSLN